MERWKWIYRGDRNNENSRMLSYTAFCRVIRRRLVLGLIFALSLTYCAFSLLRNEKKAIEDDLDDMDPMIINDNNEDIIDDDSQGSDKPEAWQADLFQDITQDNTLDALTPLNHSDSESQSCRNSVQGRVLIVDERGVICGRHEVLRNGCCATDTKPASKQEDALLAVRKERYSCKTCNAHGCCAIYEYCVSCCLHPSKAKGKRDMESRKNKEEDAMKVRLRSMDRFQFCLAACRTSSASVRHENTYKDPHSKHCYTPQSMYNRQRHRRQVKSVDNNVDNLAVVVASSSVVSLITSPLQGSIDPTERYCFSCSSCKRFY